ncbi:hypothetical protein ADL12_37775 [Streptomyces regalis]|uniref:Uncharacterized protein n=2 Tax=Streptomyces regalis TaxID=68262 RepID=A0A101JCP4_9ACTN|nr:hypothetical protein ADL12_37775 [Streptomyces regalis]
MDDTTTGRPAHEPSAARRGTGTPDRFTDLAGTRLYRRNIFAVTGLPADAKGRAVRAHRQRLETRLEVEQTWPGDTELPLVGGHRKEDVRAAFEEFQDPRRRLVDELLWRWGDRDFGCDCPTAVHRDHDEAVRCHSLVLETETGRVEATTQERDRLWAGAAAHWAELLERPEFRQHVAHRIRALDDPRLGEHTADDFLAGLPRLLVSPFGDLIAAPGLRPRLARVCVGWAEYAPFERLLPGVFEELVEETMGSIDEGVLSARNRKNEGRHEDAITILRERVLPAFDGLEPVRAFVPEWRYEEAAHVVAVALNNLAVALVDYQSTRSTAWKRQTMLELAERAYEIAPDSDADEIKANWDAIQDQFTGSEFPAAVKPIRWKKTVAGLGIAALVLGTVGYFLGPAWAVGLVFALIYMAVAG